MDKSKLLKNIKGTTLWISLENKWFLNMELFCVEGRDSWLKN